MSRSWGEAGGVGREVGRAGGAVELGKLGTNPTPPPGSAQVSASAKGGHSLNSSGCCENQMIQVPLGPGAGLVRDYRTQKALVGVGWDTHEAGVPAALSMASANHVSPDVVAVRRLCVHVVAHGGVYDADLHFLEAVGSRQVYRGVERQKERAS